MTIQFYLTFKISFAKVAWKNKCLRSVSNSRCLCFKSFPSSYAFFPTFKRKLRWSTIFNKLFRDKKSFSLISTRIAVQQQQQQHQQQRLCCIKCRGASSDTFRERGQISQSSCKSMNRLKYSYRNFPLNFTKMIIYIFSLWAT